MRSFFLLCTFLSLPVAAAAQKTPPIEKPPATTGSESLGDQLLRDLPTLAPQPKTQSDGVPKSMSAPRPSRAIPQAEMSGEDIGGPSGPLLLARVRNGMKQAEMLLGRPADAPNVNSLQQAGDVQQRVVAQLDELIAELSKQCQGGQCSPNSNPEPQASQRSSAKPSNSSRTASTSKAPARDSSDPLNRTNSEPVDKNEVNELVKQLWGHLPQRSREQVLQSFSDEFLPKYEQEIEQYYRRLSEETQERASR
jgi:hypothetical protein